MRNANTINPSIFKPQNTFNNTSFAQSGNTQQRTTRNSPNGHSPLSYSMIIGQPF